MELSEAKYDIEYDGEEFTVAGLDLYGNIWKPENAPTFIYIFVHGLGAFTTFKKDFFYLILEKGGVVFGCDHLGHGKSPGSRTSCTVGEVIDEIVQIVQLAHSKYPELPIVVHGHSFGGLSAIMMMLTKYEEVKELKENVKCAIAEAPWISKCPQRQLNSVERVGIKFLSWTFSKLRLGSGVDLFSPDLDKNWVELVSKSPLYSYDLTPRLYTLVEEAQEFCRQNVEKWPKDLPLLFCQGTDDALVDAKDNEKWINSLKEVEGVTADYKRYEKGSHVLLKCPHRPTVAKDMLDFIEAHIH
ncbi:Clan SC, family S33, methylesterase-like serine peptidase [Tritrichomonas foetus]|uniref:Clan SC, family S33, methylesterase-like serine peptidase n=1 Tax=Tritrichomonas foetus TaxID=1144522 RepID=A0A1J4KTI4_9EUKA|nr:Clan SC, family S33, methylesterase-like serine peptidase [Tritrichomonas foetus]|eukprot:OHT14571.1 Clan SC, family S33, methylesterase-like serine peptidase [Tritrichomonas foetus]